MTSYPLGTRDDKFTNSMAMQTQSASVCQKPQGLASPRACRALAAISRLKRYDCMRSTHSLRRCDMHKLAAEEMAGQDIVLHARPNSICPLKALEVPRGLRAGLILLTGLALVVQGQIPPCPRARGLDRPHPSLLGNRRPGPLDINHIIACQRQG